MADKIIVSPGVFIKENDLSYVPQGIAQIGAVIIGPTAKGPAFMPTLVSSYADFTNKFGAADGTSYVPYTAKGYLKNSNQATIVRVAGLEGYVSDALVLSISGTLSGSNYEKVVAVLAPTISSGSLIASVSQFDSSSLAFDLTISGSGSPAKYTVSLKSSDNNYIGNIFTSTPDKNKPVYLYANYKEVQNGLYASGNPLITSASLIPSVFSASINLTPEKLDTYSGYAYMEAETPYIKSQELAGIKYNLFKFVTFSVGKPDVKISIADIKYASEIPNSKYGTFSILVRDINDTDKRPVILEQFANLTLDPTAKNYIGLSIGDQYQTINGTKIVDHGTYPNRSKYVRVEMSTDSFPEICVPMGFDSYKFPISNSGSISASLCKFQDISYVESQYDNGLWNTRKYLGFDFTNESNLNVLNPTVSTQLTSSDFSLENTFVVSGSSNVSASYKQALSTPSMRKFTLSFMGGFDGINPTIDKCMGSDILPQNVMGFDLSSGTSKGTIAYKNALDIISNPDEFDINMIVIPGILYQKHSIICEYADNICNDRGDCFYIMDNTAIEASVEDSVNSIASLDTSYSAVYYPWVRIIDTDNNKYMWVPPSVVMAGVISFSDKVAAEWWAPAGLNRGGIDATQVYTRLTEDERNVLYTGRVNPITSFVGQGIVAWGQKTLQIADSARNRINVRRLLISLSKFISSVSKYLVFENNTTQLRNTFLNAVNPYMQSVKNRSGLYSFQVVMDDSNNTPDTIDRNMLVGDIYVQPSKTAEMFILSFNITRTTATFSEKQ